MANYNLGFMVSLSDNSLLLEASTTVASGSLSDLTSKQKKLIITNTGTNDAFWNWENDITTGSYADPATQISRVIHSDERIIVKIPGDATNIYFQTATGTTNISLRRAD